MMPPVCPHLSTPGRFPVRSRAILICLLLGLGAVGDAVRASASGERSVREVADGEAPARQAPDALVADRAQGWGPLPAPADSNTARPTPPPGPPAWKVALRVPYYVVTAPLWLVDQTVKGGVLGLKRLGAFELTEQVVRGVRDPLGNYWLPDGSIGDGGLELGAIVQRPDVPLPGMRMKGRVSISTLRAQLYSLGAFAPLGPRSWLEIGGGVQVRPQADYWGRTLEEPALGDEPAIYHRRTDWWGAGVRQGLGGGFELIAHGFYSAVETEDSDFETDEALDLIYAGRLPAGYGTTSAGVSGLLRLVHDDTHETGRPDRGRRIVALLHYHEPTDGTDTPFWTWGASLEQFVGLGLPQRTLALKAWWLRQRELGDDPQPFARLLRNAAPHQLRGYPTDRFHSTGLVGASAEYRWPVWVLNQPERAGVDAYLFADAGQPFDEVEQLAARHLFFSAGLGLRAIGMGAGFVLRAEAGFGREGAEIRLSGSQLFQDLKAGFFDGREPLPLVR
jgi:hypothetical protein